MRGSFKKKKAKVQNIINCKVSLEGIQRTKKEGTKVPVFFNPRALQIVSLNLEDKKRLEDLKKEEKKTSQPETTKG